MSKQPPENTDPRVEALVNQLIGRVADKWTMLVVEEMAHGEELRFTELGRRVSGISQKMLTQTLRQMERDGLVTRTIHPVIPPKVEYSLSKMGKSFHEPASALGTWALDNLERIDQARAKYDTAAN